jgi:hypothetical protein
MPLENSLAHFLKGGHKAPGFPLKAGMTSRGRPNGSPLQLPYSSVHGSTVLRQARDRAHHEREDKRHISPLLRGSMKCDLEQDRRKKLR